MALRYDRRVNGEIEVRGNALQATARVVAVDKAPRTQEEANLSSRKGIKGEMDHKRTLGVGVGNWWIPTLIEKKVTVDFCGRKSIWTAME